MKKPVSSQKPRTGTWSIHYPGINQTVPAGSLTVQVNDGVDNNQYLATVYNDVDPMPPYGGTPMSYNSSTGYYEATFTVSAPPSDKDVVVYVVDETKEYQNNPFKVAGSGSSASDSQCDLAAAALAEVFQEGRPAPVSVSAEFGAPPKPGGGLRVEGATLVYSGAPGFERCWCSQPIDLRSDGPDPALWMLERTDARTWQLRLRRGAIDLVVYRHTAVMEKDGSLPARLHVEGDGNGAGVEWPLTVTISPAP